MESFSLPKAYIKVKLINIPPPPPKKIKKIKKPKKSPVKPKLPTPEQGNLLTNQISKLSKLKQFKGTIPPINLPKEIPEKEINGLLPETDFPVEDIVLPAGTPLSSTPVPAEKGSAFSSFDRKAANLQQFSPQVGIEWSGPPRRPVQQPEIPQYTSKIEGEVKLKFWVDSTGKVTNVIVLQKLDAYLERISLQYMKQWVFEALDPRMEQVTQWGTITIRFRHD